MLEHEVVIAGAGPTGLMLAGELALAGIDVAIVERHRTRSYVGLTQAQTNWFGPANQRSPRLATSE